MQSGETLAALVGFLTAVFTSILASWIGYRKLRAEYLGKYRFDLMKKQIDACEALWDALKPTSKSIGENRVILHRSGKTFVKINVAENLYKTINDVFNSPFGLYYSRQLRESLFKLRNFLEDEFITQANGNTELQISNTRARKFDSRVQNLRISIRKELELDDLRVVAEGPIDEL
jgi:hypothetical protein